MDLPITIFSLYYVKILSWTVHVNFECNIFANI